MMQIEHTFETLFILCTYMTIQVNAGCSVGSYPTTPCNDNNGNWFLAIDDGGTFHSRRLLGSQWIGCDHAWMSCSFSGAKSQCCDKCSSNTHNYNCVTCPAGKTSLGGNEQCYTPSAPSPAPSSPSPPPPVTSCPSNANSPPACYCNPGFSGLNGGACAQCGAGTYGPGGSACAVAMTCSGGGCACTTSNGVNSNIDHF